MVYNVKFAMSVFVTSLSCTKLKTTKTALLSRTGLKVLINSVLTTLVKYFLLGGALPGGR